MMLVFSLFKSGVAFRQATGKVDKGEGYNVGLRLDITEKNGKIGAPLEKEGPRLGDKLQR